MSPGRTVKLVARLRRRLESALSDSLNDSTIYVDLGDIYEICVTYVMAVDALLKSANKEDHGDHIAWKRLMEIELQLYEHLPFHLRQLRKNLSRAINATEPKEDGVRRKRGK